ncbi:MAG: hypothetical protein KDI30_08695 [Pseudomonadales bacterium]|nr:hypothetical protein [Pseudomonadales bacterium]
MKFGKKIGFWVFILASFWSFSLCADNLAEDERITDIMLGPWNTESFAVKVTQSSQLVTQCHDKWIVFLKDNFVAADAYDKAYAQVIAALTSRQSVVIVGFDDSCQSAIGIANF